MTAPLDPAELFEQNRANLEAGLAKARRVFNAARQGRDALAHEAMEALVIDFLRPLDDEAREQLLVNALLAAVQIQHELVNVQAFAGTRKSKR